MKNRYIIASYQVLKATIGRNALSDTLDIKEVVDMILRVLGLGSVATIAFFIQGHIPGVKNLYPWVFPLIVANSTLTILVFWTAVKLKLAKPTYLGRLEALANGAVYHYNRALTMPESQADSYAQDYERWKEGVIQAFKDMGARNRIERFETIGADYKTFIPRDMSGSYRDKIANYANIFYSQHIRLRQWIDSGAFN